MSYSDPGVARQLLLVEDNPGDANYVRELLTGATERGDRVVLVPTIAEAVSALQKVPIDAVLLDLRLPDASGIEAVDRVLSRYPDAPIVVLTGMEDDDVAMACLQAGAQDFLKKEEIEESRLQRAIAYAIARARERGAQRDASEARAELAIRRGERLLQHEAQMRALNARANSVREEERARISRTVHDELSPSLTALKLDFQWVRRGLVRDEPVPTEVLVERIDSATRLMDETLRTVQRVAVELRPSALDALGLAPAARDEVRRFTEGTSLRPIMVVDLSRRCDPEIETALFRILQELLSNVVRHAHATEVRVELRLEDDRLHLIVQDNGVGLPDGGQERPTALGILGVRERARILGGDVRLGPAPAGGTRVHVQLPVEEADP